ncbi:FAD-binding domain-containing protein [Apiospora marii]|uniref:FAD-binding domain-containing protein n=1 Tax=Apiospora marii TaxID=335849 RepID=UPI00312DA605
MTMIRAASEAVVSELMRSGLNKDLLSPAGSIRYDERIASYFSLTAQKKPFCFVHPKTTEDVALILKAILANPEGPLRHPQRWPRHTKGLVSIQPGARWRDVYKHLGDAHGEVAGLLTGGGISWYIPRFKDVITTTFLANTKGVESPPELRRLCNIPTLHRDLKQTNLHDFACSMDQPMGMQ